MASLDELPRIMQMLDQIDRGDRLKAPGTESGGLDRLLQTGQPGLARVRGSGAGELEPSGVPAAGLGLGHQQPMARADIQQPARPDATIEQLQQPPSGQPPSRLL